MHLISRKKLREVWAVDRELEKPLRAWIKVVEGAEWHRFSDVRATIKHADQVDRFTVFNILGNRFRLICVIHYDRGKVFIRHVPSHAEYDRGAWKRDRRRATGMAKRSKPAVKVDRGDKYIDLVRAVPLRPIRSDAELDRAITMIDSLVTRDDLDSGEEDYLDVLSDLVHKYEAERDPIATVSDADMVRFLLESNDMTQAALAERSEVAESTISEVVAGKRNLSRRHIAAFSRVFRVNPSIFFHEKLEMTPERVAGILSRRSGVKISRKILDALAGAFAMDSSRIAWRALQELVAGDRSGVPIDLVAKRLNEQGGGGDSCWSPVPLQLTGEDVQALADAFSSEEGCWKVFRELVEETISEMRVLQREVVEEN